MTDSPSSWEHLITDGHVRAARVRKLQPVWIVVALILILAGWFAMGLVDPGKAENDREQTLRAEIDQQRWRAIDAFAGLPVPRVGSSKVETLIPGDEIEAIHTRILTELNRTDDLPEDIQFKEVEASAFWRVPWKAGEIVTTSTGSVRAVGAIVGTGSVSRYLGVFRYESGEWEAVTIASPGFLTLNEVTPVSIEEIPVTLEPILETEE